MKYIVAEGAAFVAGGFTYEPGAEIDESLFCKEALDNALKNKRLLKSSDVKKEDDNTDLKPEKEKAKAAISVAQAELDAAKRILKEKQAAAKNNGTDAAIAEAKEADNAVQEKQKILNEAIKALKDLKG